MNTVKLEIIIKRDFNITNAEYQMIRQLGAVGELSRVDMIKFIRMQYDTDLRTAKNIVDTILNKKHTNKIKTNPNYYIFTQKTTTLGELLRSKMG